MRHTHGDISFFIIKIGIKGVLTEIKNSPQIVKKRNKRHKKIDYTTFKATTPENINVHVTGNICNPSIYIIPRKLAKNVK